MNAKGELTHGLRWSMVETIQTPPAKATSRFIVMHVDDDPDDAFFVRRAFSKSNLGVTLCHVADGPTALAYLTGDGVYSDRLQFPPPSLMLLDIKLPLMDGFEILRWVRRHEQFRGLRVFMLSSSGHILDRSRARELGADRFFVKSVNFTDVIETLRPMLNEEFVRHASLGTFQSGPKGHGLNC